MVAILSGRRKAVEEAIAALKTEDEAFRSMLESFAGMQDSLLRLAEVVVEYAETHDHIGSSDDPSDSTTQGQL